ncbi:heterogeneous nuclear ribonucleoprotein 87F-like [Rhopalosiphum maidis]|uniref:heterogeneous nuclear ribonucleoprotein 87F-like n=1 Tax=Rhopalosiphum maidis TaxID=43146 RepID=UPI000EFEB616|nr:heterogeneous nuclear ribonucleoprotein 87F-like [Rhopalosiphum maidis]
MGSNCDEQNRQLFIGGLNFQTTNKSLRDFFEQWGKVEAAFVKRNPQTKQSRGFGFVTYSQSYMVDQAMSNTPHRIDGREVETKIALPRSVINEPNNTIDVKKVFVSGISEQSEHDIFEYFRQFGNINFLKIVSDNYTGKIKGFGFIKYDVKASADKVLSIRSHLVAGGKLNVKKAFSHRIQGSYGYVGRCHYLVTKARLRANLNH